MTKAGELHIALAKKVLSATYNLVNTFISPGAHQHVTLLMFLAKFMAGVTPDSQTSRHMMVPIAQAPLDGYSCATTTPSRGAAPKHLS